MAKMFVHYKGTVEAFKTAGLETTYANSIVFIKGGDDGTGAAVFTHGCYYANVDEALGALAYFKSVSDGTNVASAVDKNGVITFSADDPASVSVKVDEKGVHFALTEDFVKAVNETIPASVTAVDGKVDAEVERATQAEADLQTAVEAKAVTIDTTSTTDGYLKSYTIKQGTTTLGVIDIPKELVVTGGEVIVADAEEGLTKGEKYLKLSIANQEAPVYIAVKDLVDVYVGSAYIEISDSNEISIKTDDLKTALGIPTIETNLANLSAIVGTQTDEGATGDNATAFGRIKNLEEVVAGLTGSEDGSVESVETQINNAINSLKGDMTSGTIGALEKSVIWGVSSGATNIISTNESAVGGKTSVAVGLTTDAKTAIEDLMNGSYVKSVNNATPDEDGNVVIAQKVTVFGGGSEMTSVPTTGTALRMLKTTTNGEVSFDISQASDANTGESTVVVKGSVVGLGSAAYTEASDYAQASRVGVLTDVLGIDPQTDTTIDGTNTVKAAIAELQANKLDTTAFEWEEL